MRWLFPLFPDRLFADGLNDGGGGLVNRHGNNRTWLLKVLPVGRDVLAVGQAENPRDNARIIYPDQSTIELVGLDSLSNEGQQLRKFRFCFVVVETLPAYFREPAKARKGQRTFTRDRYGLSGRYLADIDRRSLGPFPVLLEDLLEAFGSEFPRPPDLAGGFLCFCSFLFIVICTFYVPVC